MGSHIFLWNRVCGAITALLLSFTNSNAGTVTQKKDEEKSSHSKLTVVSFNILASIWVDPKDWDKEFRSYLAIDKRRESIDNSLKELNADVLCLQEVTAREFAGLTTRSSSKYQMKFYSHRKGYWEKYLGGKNKYEDHGNAVFLTKERFSVLETESWDLSPDGNIATAVFAFDKKSKRKILVISAHLDAEEKNDMRISQVKELIRRIDNFKTIHKFPLDNGKDSHSLTVIIGSDMNEGHFSGEILHKYLGEQGYINAWSVFKQSYKYSHPFDNGGDKMDLDYIYVSQNTNIFSFVVVDEVPKNLKGNDRIREALKLYGSDHFPVKAEIGFDLK